MHNSEQNIRHDGLALRACIAALLFVIAIHCLGTRTDDAQVQSGSAFNAYTVDVTTITGRDAAAQQVVVAPTPVPPFDRAPPRPPVESPHAYGWDRILSEARAPPRFEYLASVLRPRAP